jgi:predicted 3-demethylubiquinone-9 3-methyltransferase (glyoxalase superfamily)
MTKAITPNLWFDGNAKEAVGFYVSVFPDSKITATTYYPNTKEEGLADFQSNMAGKVLTIEFELRGSPFLAINAGSRFKFNEAVSFAVACKNQEEIDYYWEKLSAVPEAEQCGWLKDNYGLSWQIVPKNADELLRRPGAFANMMKMKKLVIADY